MCPVGPAVEGTTRVLPICTRILAWDGVDVSPPTPAPGRVAGRSVVRCGRGGSADQPVRRPSSPPAIRSVGHTGAVRDSGTATCDGRRPAGESQRTQNDGRTGGIA